MANICKIQAWFLRLYQGDRHQQRDEEISDIKTYNSNSSQWQWIGEYVDDENDEKDDEEDDESDEWYW